MNFLDTYEDTIHLKDNVTQLQKQLHSVLTITQAINANTHTPELIELYKQTLQKHLGVDEIALFIYNEAWKRPLYIHQEKEEFIPVENNIRQYALATKLNKEEQLLFNGFKYVIPVYHKKQPLAFALFGDINNTHQQTEDSLLEFAQVITNIIAVAIENKRLFYKEVEKKNYDKELELASKVQTMLIPKQLPKNKMYEFAGLYIPYKGIGGDYYDVIHISKDEFVFCIGDISGKGIAAALVMANIQAYLNAIVESKVSDLQFIERLNRKVFSITNGDKYITLFIAKYNIVTRKLVYINCGHVPPILCNDTACILLDKGTTMLGVFEELPKINIQTIDIPNESILVSFTDGLNELENNEDQQYSCNRIYEFVAKYHKYSTEVFNKVLYDDICKYKGNKLFNDDISVLTARFY
ncbi:MAG: SpoIIE family protein phosphatase [Chitinophagales bacterium]|nr:SpoIIE family protein phosphatase [Chitinophagales bacterium]